MTAQRLLRRREVESITGLSRSSIYDEMAKERFPKPVTIGPRAVAWVESEITQWQNQRIAQRDGQAA